MDIVNLTTSLETRLPIAEFCRFPPSPLRVSRTRRLSSCQTLKWKSHPGGRMGNVVTTAVTAALPIHTTSMGSFLYPHNPTMSRKEKICLGKREEVH